MQPTWELTQTTYFGLSGRCKSGIRTASNGSSPSPWNKVLGELVVGGNDLLHQRQAWNGDLATDPVQHFGGKAGPGGWNLSAPDDCDLDHPCHPRRNAQIRHIGEQLLGGQVFEQERHLSGTCGARGGIRWLSDVHYTAISFGVTPHLRCKQAVERQPLQSTVEGTGIGRQRALECGGVPPLSFVPVSQEDIAPTPTSAVAP